MSSHRRKTTPSKVSPIANSANNKLQIATMVNNDDTDDKKSHVSDWRRNESNTNYRQMVRWRTVSSPHHRMGAIVKVHRHLVVHHQHYPMPLVMCGYQATTINHTPLSLMHKHWNMYCHRLICRLGTYFKTIIIHNAGKSQCIRRCHSAIIHNAWTSQSWGTHAAYVPGQWNNWWFVLCSPSIQNILGNKVEEQASVIVKTDLDCDDEKVEYTFLQFCIFVAIWN